MKMAVLVSGGGTNLQAIIDEHKKGRISNCEIAVVVSSKPDVLALERAEKAGIPTEVVDVKSVSKSTTKSDTAFEDELLRVLKKYKVDFVVLAGFMCILGKKFINKFENKIINVHPSLIPEFCGKGFYGLVPHKAVLEEKRTFTGATVHFVTEGADEGPVIMRKIVPVKKSDNAERLQKRVMQWAEWEILPRAIDLFCKGKLKVIENKVIIE